MSGKYNTFTQGYLLKDDAFQKIIVDAQKTFLPLTKYFVA